eukprot:CAMPEP_0172721810 /NCGR_PEP_ID=MMETSP1074-20121228/79924_1 /TAXON_ID=2916 /ORGANISM="Ceratium fusus, Strain PA161109" /LENGTH=354 /DNA_ID=CAMNT_0013547651 /DNA_START=203 /DNA_END=1267 /DNA_ORIENTATION=-
MARENASNKDLSPTLAQSLSEVQSLSGVGQKQWYEITYYCLVVANFVFPKLLAGVDMDFFGDADVSKGWWIAMIAVWGMTTFFSYTVDIMTNHAHASMALALTHTTVAAVVFDIPLFGFTALREIVEEPHVVAWATDNPTALHLVVAYSAAAVLNDVCFWGCKGKLREVLTGVWNFFKGCCSSAGARPETCPSPEMCPPNEANAVENDLEIQLAARVEHLDNQNGPGASFLDLMMKKNEGGLDERIQYTLQMMCHETKGLMEGSFPASENFKPFLGQLEHGPKGSLRYEELKTIVTGFKQDFCNNLQEIFQRSAPMTEALGPEALDPNKLASRINKLNIAARTRNIMRGHAILG